MSKAAVGDGTVLADHPAPGVRRLRIDNPAQRGALSQSVLTALDRGIVQTPEDIRCLVLTGSGSTFCAGYDLAALDSPPDPVQADATIAPDFAQALNRFESQPLPVIAALNGAALGGGLELALACDVRLAVPEAMLGAPAGTLGLVYSPGGLERMLAEMPFAIAADLFLTGRTLAAERARDLGLVNDLVAAEDLAQAPVDLAVRVAKLAPLSVQANRHALRALRRSCCALGPEDHAHLTDARQHAMRSPDFAEGVAAFRERRIPRFNGRR